MPESVRGLRPDRLDVPGEGLRQRLCEADLSSGTVDHHAQCRSAGDYGQPDRGRDPPVPARHPRRPRFHRKHGGFETRRGADAARPATTTFCSTARAKSCSRRCARCAASPIRGRCSRRLGRRSRSGQSRTRLRGSASLSSRSRPSRGSRRSATSTPTCPSSPKANAASRVRVRLPSMRPHQHRHDPRSAGADRFRRDHAAFQRRRCRFPGRTGGYRAIRPPRRARHRRRPDARRPARPRPGGGCPTTCRSCGR